MLLGIIVLCVAEALLIAGLLAQRVKHRRAEGALRESEARFRLMADAAPVLIWTSGVDKACTYCSRPWLEFTGRPLERELGDGWAEGVHPDDLPRCLEVYATHFDARAPFEIVYRLRRHDGEYRWVLDRGVPRLTTDGEFAGYIGACADITERKRAEEGLREGQRELQLLTGRLLEAQEAERRRNVVKHSGSRHASVELSGTADAIRLRVTDDGVGFEPDSAAGAGGLGLVSMRERLNLVGGGIAIDSRPSGGTRIDVRVPVTAP